MKVGARYYDPTIGRWIQKAPILSGFNWWVYCENDPVNKIDPSGKSWVVEFIIEWIGVGFGGWYTYICITTYVVAPAILPAAGAIIGVTLVVVAFYGISQTIDEFVGAAKP